MKHLEVEIEEIRKMKKLAVSQQQYEEAANLRDTEKKKKVELEETLKKWEDDANLSIVEVNDDTILHVVAQLTGIPMRRMEEEEANRILRMEEELSKVVIGQQDAVSLVAKAMRRSRADLKDPNRPIGSFIFLGPTGVGKTLLARNIARFMFGDEDALVQVDMSEFMEKFNVSRLVGSPPGYVGHDEGGQLTEKVRKRPYSVVLFDEIEKAHPDVINMLLQILEDGRLTDSLGVKVDFRNTIVILTSNVGAREITNGGTLGFSNSSSSGGMDYDYMKDKLQDALKKQFRPEFINRVDEVIVFRQLAEEALRKIIDIEVGKVASRLERHGIELVYDDELKDHLISLGHKPEYGARPLRRIVERFVEDPLAETILRGEVADGTRLKLVPDDKKVRFEVVEKECEVSDG